jgi:hypothetical protein
MRELPPFEINAVTFLIGTYHFWFISPPLEINVLTFLISTYPGAARQAQCVKGANEKAMGVQYMAMPWSIAMSTTSHFYTTYLMKY